MSYVMKDDRVAYMVDGTEMGYALFSEAYGEKNVIQITSTHVDEALRGKGIAGNLIKKIAELATEKGWRVRPTCSYAGSWFARHPDYINILE